MDLPTKRIALGDVKNNQDQTIDIVDCSYRSKLVHLDPTVVNGDFVILIHHPGASVTQVYKFESDYYFENLNRLAILDAVKEKFRQYSLEVLDLGLLYDRDGKWYLRDRLLELTFQPLYVTCPLKSI